MTKQVPVKAIREIVKLGNGIAKDDNDAIEEHG
jgi:hypothetical protein